MFAAIEDVGQRERWPSDLTFKVKLLIEEIGINIMDHAYLDSEGEFEVTLTSEADAVTIEILDDGQPFDPLEDAPIPDLDSTVEGRDIGGLGLHLVRTMADESSYQRREGKNRLTLVARR